MVVICDYGSGYIKTGSYGQSSFSHLVPSQEENALGRAISAVDQKDLESGYILVMHSTNLSPKQKEMVAEQLFEKHGFKHVSFSLEAILSLYSLGLSTGIVVDLGESMINTVPIHNGYSLKHCIRKTNFGGRELTEYLIKLLSKIGYYFDSRTDTETVRMLKKDCYVGYDMAEETRLGIETTYLNKTCGVNGKTVRMGVERVQAPEALFNPDLIGIETENLPSLVFNTIQNVDLDARPGLYENIVVIGGSSKFPGLKTRLGAEIERLYTSKIMGKSRDQASAKFDFRLDAKRYGSHLGFHGGSVLVDLMKKNPEFWVTKDEWSTDGPQSILRTVS